MKPIKEGDTVVHEVKGKAIHGKVTDVGSQLAAVDFGLGEKLVLNKRDIKPVTGSRVRASMPISDKQPGFHQYEIEWRDQEGNVLKFNQKECANPAKAIRFIAFVEDVQFLGQWRKTQHTETDDYAWAIDMFARPKPPDGQEAKSFTMAPLYYEYDPRLGEIPGKTKDLWLVSMKTLNSDICAAINRWLYFHFFSNLESIEDLTARAANPILEFHDLDSFYKLVRDIHQFYNTAVTSGGTRSMTIQSGKSKQRVTIVADFTSQIISRDFKVGTVTVPDDIQPSAAPTKAKNFIVQASNVPAEITAELPKRGRKQLTPEPTGSVKSMIARLKEIGAVPKRQRSIADIREAKKLRAALRASGHHGGAQ